VAKKRAGVEGEHHVVGVRLRVTGSGNLHLKFSDLNDTRSYAMVDLPLSATNRIEPTRLANFQSQRIRLEGSMTELNDWFHIRRVIIYDKMVAVEYPG
jgi:hypothetical protein